MGAVGGKVQRDQIVLGSDSRLRGKNLILEVRGQPSKAFKLRTDR